MEESRDQQKLYSFFQGIIYLSIILEFVIVLFLGKGFLPPIIQELFWWLAAFSFIRIWCLASCSPFFLSSSSVLEQRPEKMWIFKQPGTSWFH
jgi:hypothetical protein